MKIVQQGLYIHGKGREQTWMFWNTVGVVGDDRGGGYAKLRIMKAFSFQTIDPD